jgi:uracil-DNA glycosylase
VANIKLRDEWLRVLQGEFDQPYMQALSVFLRAERAAGKIIYPPGRFLFSALEATPPDAVKVVLLGQDPYHGPDQAHGLSFSVLPGQAIPPSLRNIFQELHADLGFQIPSHGCLCHWAKQGVLLLNTVLSVESGRAGSHQGKGWEQFTDAVIRHLDQEGGSKVFLLWGAHAQKKGAGISEEKHLVLRAPHPSPLSAHRGFLGCRHFSQANDFLTRQGFGAIDWQIPIG